MRARSERWLLGLGLALLPPFALPAAPDWPTPEAIERAREAHPLPDLKRLGEVPVPGLPKVAPSRPGLDIEELARRHLRLDGRQPEIARESPALHVFVTLAMPQQSLRLLVDQAERSGATLLLRGLKGNSMKQTLTAVHSLIGARKVAWQIDPEAFTRYGIRQAPTFVLTGITRGQDKGPGACASNCAATTAYYSVAGDVSLDYALEAIVRRRPDAARFAAPFLKRLRATP